LRESASELQTRVEALTRELEEARAEQAATAAVLRVIASSPTDIQPVLDGVVASAAKLCNSYDAALLLRNGDALEVCAHFGPIPIDFSAVPLTRDWAVGKSVLDCTIIHTPDLAAPDHEFAAGRASAMRQGFRTGLATPLVRRSEAIGTLTLRRIEVRPFTDEQIALVSGFASQAVIAIENARLFSELEARNREILSRYFSPNLAQRLAAGADEIELAGQRRQVAAVFTDIEGFTSLIETMEPCTLSDLLNGYLAGMTSVVFSHEGTVAKIVGDALHILFGAPGDQPDRAARAIACALDLDDFAQSFRETWRQKRTALGPTRIGVNAGSAIVGNFGGGRFFDYTAYGDTINIAARLEAANKQLGTRICVSESVVRQVPDFRGRPVGDLVLRGRSEPLRAFEPLRPEQFGDASTKAYLDAFAKLESSDPDALGAFAAAVSRKQGDRLASFHLKRLLNGATGTRIEMD
jgi:class 3 adenylate cyclase